MAVIVTLRATLAGLTQQQLRAAIEPRVFSKGSAYYRGGRVTRLTVHDVSLNAWVSGSRAQPYHVACRDADRGHLRCTCSCPFVREWISPCKHLVAALLAWMAQRDQRNSTLRNFSTGHPTRRSHHIHRIPRRTTQPPVRPFLRDTPAWMHSFRSPILGRQTEPWTVGPMAWLFAGNFFSGSGSLRAEVSLAEDEASLQVTLTAEPSARQATFRIPREEIPNFLAQCRRATDFRWNGSAQALELRRRPLEPCLVADYDDEGRLVLEPRYALPKRHGQPAELLTAQAVERGQVGAQWWWGTGGVYPIAPVPRRLRPYFHGESPLIYEGAAVPQFFEMTYHRLAEEIAFRPSAAVRRTRILPTPLVSHVKLDVDGPEWLWCEPTYFVQDHEVALRDILAAHSHGARYLRRGEVWITLPDHTELLDDLGGAEPDANGRARLSHLQYLRARAAWDPARVRLEESAQARQFRELIDRLAPPTDPPPLDERMTALRPYQQAGYRWLWFLHVNGFHGLLADEMGLGKTHQAMALLHAAWTSRGDAARPPLNGYGPRPSLIVCPTTVLDHWAEKLRRHAPALHCLRLHGLERPRSLMDIELPPVVLTTYALMVKDAAMFEPIEWEYVILDEAQKIKNPLTQMARAVKRLRAKHRLALTGTPLENRPMELWAVFEFLLPGYLESARDFRRRFETPIVQQGDARSAKRLRRLIDPFKLRRCKAEVLTDLPPKIEDVRRCELTPHQAALYRTVLERAGALIDGLRDRSRSIEYLHVFAVLTRLKRLCDHPALVLQGQRARSLVSGKFALFQELLDETLASDQKVVVFSQYVEMLSLMAAELARRRVGYVVLQSATRDRGKVIRTFQETPSCRVFLGSLLAGGLGIDLTAATVVIHYDRWWNAAREDQATDRVHRIGQSRGVQVFKLVTTATLEERIHRMIERKRAMMETLVTSDVDHVKAFTREELLELLDTTPPARATRKMAALTLAAV